METRSDPVPALCLIVLNDGARSPINRVAHSLMSNLLGFDPMKAMGGILDRKEEHIAVRAGFTLVHRIRRNIENGPSGRVDLLAANNGVECSLQNINPLLVRMGMALSPG